MFRVVRFCVVNPLPFVLSRLHPQRLLPNNGEKGTEEYPVLGGLSGLLYQGNLQVSSHQNLDHELILDFQKTVQLALGSQGLSLGVQGNVRWSARPVFPGNRSQHGRCHGANRALTSCRAQHNQKQFVSAGQYLYSAQSLGMHHNNTEPDNFKLWHQSRIFSINRATIYFCFTWIFLPLNRCSPQCKSCFRDISYSRA